MPIRFTDPFIDPLVNLNLSVNRYAQLLRDGGEDPAIPLSYGPSLKGSAGTWRQKLSAQMAAPVEQLWVEIGCHNGDTALELAQARPQNAVVGLDITFKRVVKTAQKSTQNGQANLHSILCNAGGMAEVFAKGEIDGILLFFPDPWVRKKSQRKNRLLGEEFARSAWQLLATSGFFWFKTDQLDYFEEGAAALRAAGFHPLEAGQLPVAGLSPTTFESHFTERGVPFYEGCWQKPPPSGFIQP